MAKDLNFKNIESLGSIQRVVKEAGSALQDSSRTIDDSSMSETLSAVAGAGIGAAASFGALYGLGVTGLSAAGITSGLAAAGALVGGGMVAGIGVLAAPVAGLAVGGYAIVSSQKKKKLIQAKEQLLWEAIRKRDAIAHQLKQENQENSERLEYLTTLNTMLQAAVRDLQQDLAA